MHATRSVPRPTAMRQPSLGGEGGGGACDRYACFVFIDQFIAKSQLSLSLQVTAFYDRLASVKNIYYYANIKVLKTNNINSAILVGTTSVCVSIGICA